MRMPKLSAPARVGFTLPGLPHNIISGAEIVDAGCKLRLDKHAAGIELEGKVLYRGWRDKASRLWSFNIDPNEGNSLTPYQNINVPKKMNNLFATYSPEQPVWYLYLL